MPPIDQRPKPKVRVKAKPKKPYTLPKTFKPADTNRQPVKRTPAAPSSIYVKPKLGPPAPPKRHVLPKTFKPPSSDPRDRLTPRQTRENDRSLVHRWDRAEKRRADERKEARDVVRRKARLDQPFGPLASPTLGMPRERYERVREAAKREYEREHRDTDTKIGPFNVEAELEGRGLLGKVAEGAKKALPTEASFPTSARSSRKMGVPVTRLGREAIDISANLPSSVYMAGAAGKEAAEGDPERAKKLWKDYKETSAIPAAVAGDWKEAGKRANEHPIATGLELWGAKAVVGRTAGAAARKAPLPKGRVKDVVRKAGSTERPNLRLYPEARRGEGPEVARKYSKDSINKLGQKVAERHARRRGQDPNVDRGTHASFRAPQKIGDTTRPKIIRRVDTRVFSQDRAATTRKMDADKGARKLFRGAARTAETRRARVAKNVRSPRATHRQREALLAGVQLVGEGTVRRTRIREDLNSRNVALAREYQNLTDPARKRLNREEAKHVRELIALPDAQLQRVVAAADTFTKQQAPVQARGSKVGAWTEEGQSKRFYPAVQSHTQVPKAAALPATREAPIRRTATTPQEKAHLQRRAEGERRTAEARSRMQDPLETAAKSLQRRSRRGQSTMAGLPKGGPALITQRPGRPRVGARLRPGAPFEPTKSRSGKAFQEGSRDVGRASLLRQAVESEASVTAAEGFQLLDRELGIKAGKDGKRYAGTRDEALTEASRQTLDPATGQLKPNAIPLVPVNIAQFQTFGSRLTAKQAEGMPRSYTGIAGMERQAAKEAWDAAVNESGRGKWVLMPEPAVQRLRDHADVPTHGALQTASDLFKDAVLTTAAPSGWIFANLTDLGVRTAFAGIRPVDIVRGARIEARMQQKGLQGEQAASASFGGGLFHAADAINKSGRPAGYLENPARTIVATPWRAWKGGVYGLEHFIEKLPQWGVAGKAARQETPGHRGADAGMKESLKGLLKLQDELIDNFATKMSTDRAHEARIQKMTEDVVGRWGKISPAMKRALLIAPFAQWLGAATRYTFVTLPAHHPIKTGLLASIHDMTERERQALGLSYFVSRDKQAQDYQMGTLPMEVGKNKYGPTVKGWQAKRLTSLGTAADAAGLNVGGFLLPQFMGAFNAARGNDFTGRQLVYPDWWPEEKLRGLPLPPDVKANVAAGMLIESTVPFSNMYRKSVMEKGRPQEPYSTILTPETRKDWNKADEQFIADPGTRTGGIISWIMPLPESRKVYTLGATKQIGDNRTTIETLEKWNADRKKPKGDFDFRGSGNTDSSDDWNFSDDAPKAPKKGEKRDDSKDWDFR